MVSERAASSLRRISPTAERNHEKESPHYKYRETSGERHSTPDRRSEYTSEKVLSRGLRAKMTKRKLRSCSQCGVRHGPPCGKYCSRLEVAFEKLNEEMARADVAAGGAASGGDAERASEEKLLEEVPIIDQEGGVSVEDGTDTLHQIP